MPEPEPVVIEFGAQMSFLPVFDFSQAAMVWNEQLAVCGPASFVFRQYLPLCTLWALAGPDNAKAVTKADSAIAYRIVNSSMIAVAPGR
jgi:hypothetical protein